MTADFALLYPPYNFRGKTGEGAVQLRRTGGSGTPLLIDLASGPQGIPARAVRVAERSCSDKLR